MAIELDTGAAVSILLPPSRILNRWAVNGIEADATGGIEIVPAPGAGQRLYLEYFELQSEIAAVDPNLQDEDGTVLFGPYATTTNGVGVTIDLKDTPIMLAENKALDVHAAGAGALQVFAKGFTALA